MEQFIHEQLERRALWAASDHAQAVARIEAVRREDKAPMRAAKRGDFIGRPNPYKSHRR